MVYTFIKALGGKIGNSICEDDQIETAKSIMAKAEAKGIDLDLRREVVVADSFSNDANFKIVDNFEIPDGCEAMDADPSSLKLWQEIIDNSGTVLWNGPLESLKCPILPNLPMLWQKCLNATKKALSPLWAVAIRWRLQHRWVMPTR